jgi:hypothetical protein
MCTSRGAVTAAVLTAAVTAAAASSFTSTVRSWYGGPHDVMCPLASHSHGALIATPPTLHSKHLFRVLGGSCTASANGCITSANFPASYTNGENCTIVVGTDVSLVVQSFATEQDFDVLYRS